MKLARKIILLLLGMFVLLLGSFAFVEARGAVRKHDADTTENLAIMGRSLAPAFAEVYAVEGEARALTLLRRADAEMDQVKIRVISLSPRGPEPFDHALSKDQLAALVRGEEVSTGREAGMELRFYEPVSSAGAIEISQALESEGHIVLGRLEERLGLAVAAALVAALFSVLASVRLVGGPMSALVQQARRIGAGDLAHRPKLTRADEIGELSNEMNKMCDQLEAAQRKIAEEADARVQALEQLRHADRLSTVGRLASGMAHELGTPLSIVGGRAKMIASGEPAREDSAQFGKIIVGQVEKMTRIMRGLLDFARRKPVQKAPADVREIAKRTIELLTPLAKKTQVVLRLEAGDPMTANVDVAQVEQALANLVMNGIYAMPGGGDLAVSVDVVRARPPSSKHAPEERFLRVRVRDEGSGIAPEHLPHVFEPFFTTKDVGEGTGLGLSVTYGIMHDHGGFIDVESESGKGSSFSLYFRAEAGSE